MSPHPYTTLIEPIETPIWDWGDFIKKSDLNLDPTPTRRGWIIESVFLYKEKRRFYYLNFLKKTESDFFKKIHKSCIWEWRVNIYGFCG